MGVAKQFSYKYMYTIRESRWLIITCIVQYTNIYIIYNSSHIMFIYTQHVNFIIYNIFDKKNITEKEE